MVRDLVAVGSMKLWYLDANKLRMHGAESRFAFSLFFTDACSDKEKKLGGGSHDFEDRNNASPENKHREMAHLFEVFPHPESLEDGKRSRWQGVWKMECCRTDQFTFHSQCSNLSACLAIGVIPQDGFFLHCEFVLAKVFNLKRRTYACGAWP